MKTLKHTLSALFAVLASIVMLPAMAERTISSDYTLSANEDWTGDGKVRLVQGAKIDLNGYRLKVAGFAEYLPLDYVETDGNQWVNTCFTPANTDKVEMKVRFTANNGQFLYCSRSGTQNHTTFSLYCGKSGDSGIALRFDCGSAGTVTSALDITYDYILTADANARTYEVRKTDGTTAASGDMSKETLDVVGPFALFGSHSAGANLSPSTSIDNKAHCRFYYFKVFASDGTTLKCDIIPVYGVNEKKVGLYDRVSGRFLPAIGNDFAGNYYPELDFIDTDGHQWINTLYRPTCTNAVEMKASVANVSGTQFLYCNRRAKSGNGARHYSLVITGGKTRFDYQEKQGANYSVSNGEPYVFSASPNTDDYSLVCKVDGNNAGSVSGAYFTPNPYFCLFGSYEATTLQDSTEVSNLASCRFYYFKVWDTKDRGTLKCDIVPVYSVTDDAFGLYDRVARRLLPNKGTSPFPNPLSNSIVNGAADVGEVEVSAQEDQEISITSIGSGIVLTKSGAGALTFANGLSLSTAFRPVAGTISGVTLLDGATLDVSGLSGAFSLDDNAIAFADAAKVYINVGSRTVTKNTALVSWTSAPANIGGLKIRLVASGKEHSMLVKSDGLYRSPAGLILTFY